MLMENSASDWGVRCFFVIAGIVSKKYLFLQFIIVSYEEKPS